jgi:hypothetical protein
MKAEANIFPIFSYTLFRQGQQGIFVALARARPKRFFLVGKTSRIFPINAFQTRQFCKKSRKEYLWIFLTCFRRRILYIGREDTIYFT